MLKWQLVDGWAVEPTHKINEKDLGNPPLANLKIRHEIRFDVIAVRASIHRMAPFNLCFRHKNPDGNHLTPLKPIGSSSTWFELDWLRQSRETSVGGAKHTNRRRQHFVVLVWIKVWIKFWKSLERVLEQCLEQ